MSFSYSGMPGSNTVDAVRFLVEDTDSTNPLLQDEEIEWLLAENTGYYSAAKEAATRLAMKFLRMAQSKRLGDLSVTYANRAQWYMQLVKELNNRALRSDLVPTPYCGGISEADKEIDNADPDIIHRFKVSPTPDIYLVP